MNTNETLLVTGASGKLGQLVLKTLVKNKNLNIIATSRNPEKLNEFSTQGILVRKADFTDPASLIEAFRGATRLLLISTDAIGSRIEQHGNAITAAKKAGVKHIVYTSWANPDISPAIVSAEHLETERLIKESGLSHTILRNYPYAENLFMSLPNALKMGAFYGTAGKGKVAYVTKEDCADAAAGALSSKDVSNQTLNITGPQSINYDELLDLVAEVTGKKIPYVDIKPGDFLAALVKSGLPEFWADAFVSFDLSFKQNDVAEVSDAVERLSGHKPKALRNFLIENKNSFI